MYNGEDNTEYGKYYTADCNCDCTRKESLLVKSGQLLSMYDIVPGNTLHSNKDVINWDRAKLIANKLVDDFNAISDKQGYKKIKYVEA